MLFKINNISQSEIIDLLNKNKMLHFSIKKYIETSENEKLKILIKKFLENFDNDNNISCISIFTLLFANLDLKNKNVRQIINKFYSLDIEYFNIEQEIVLNILVMFNKIDEVEYIIKNKKIDKYVLENVLVQFTEYCFLDLCLIYSLDSFIFCCNYFNLDMFVYIKSALQKNYHINFDKYNPNHYCIIDCLVDYINNNKNLKHFTEIVITYPLQYSQNNYNVIQKLLSSTQNIGFFDTYLINCLNNLNVFLIKDFLKIRALNIKDLNFADIFSNLLEISTMLEHDLHSKKQIVIIWSAIFKYIEKYLDEDTIKHIMSYFKLNAIFALPNAKQIIKKLKPYIDDINELDEYDFTPLMDCLRYGDYKTVNYLLNRFENNLYQISYENFNLIDCALFNSDHRIIKILTDFLVKNNVNLKCNLLKSYVPPKKYNQKILTLIDYYKKLNYDIYQTFINKVFQLNLHKYELLNVIIENYDFKVKSSNIFIKVNAEQCSILNGKKYNYDDTKKVNLFKKVIDRLENIKLDTILKIISIGCFKYINKLLIYLESKKIKFDDYNINLSTFNSIFNCSSNCDCCKKNIQKQFREFLMFLKYKIIKSDELIYFKNEFMCIYDDTIIQELLKCGFMPTLFNINILMVNSMCRIKSIDNSLCFLVEKIKKLKTQYNYDAQSEIDLYRWYIVILTMKKYVKKKNKKRFEYIKDLYNPVNFEIIFNPKNKIKNTGSVIPKHIHPLDFFKSINISHNYITYKADGVYKRGLFNIYPRINLNIESSNIEYEQVKNLCYIFNYINEYTDVFTFINKLRSIHPYVPNTLYPDLDLRNVRDVITSYYKEEIDAINNFKSKNINSSYKLWWPKYIFRIKPHTEQGYIKLMEIITEIKLDLFENDGWILIDNDYSNLLKVKPNSHLTIDLLYRNNKLIDNTSKSYNFVTNNDINLQQNKIYRCYFNEKQQMWMPRDLRIDKKRANDNDICSMIEKQHIYKWNFKDIKFNYPYYQKQSYCNNKYKTSLTYVKEKIKGNVLDLGCGFKSKYFKNNSNIKNYVGFDKDIKILNTEHNDNLYIVDLCKDWDYNSQKLEYLSLINYIPNICDFNKLNFKADTVLCINSVHYFINNLDVLIKNVNKYVKVGTRFLIQFLDKDLLDSIICKTGIIKNDVSYIKKIDNSTIKIYYDWVHKMPLTEKLVNKKSLIESIENYEWVYESLYSQKLDTNNSDWVNYFKCFSVISFVKK